MEWYQFKLFIEHGSGVTMDALHVLIGVCVQLLVAAVFRTSVGRWTPWLFVLAVQVLNEVSDFWLDIWPDWGMQWGEAAKDVVLTMALPTILMLAVRHKPQLFQRKSQPPPEINQGQLNFDFVE